MKPIRCLFGHHTWRLSILQPLNLARGEYAVICDGCGKHETKSGGKVLPARPLGKGRS